MAISPKRREVTDEAAKRSPQAIRDFPKRRRNRAPAARPHPAPSYLAIMTPATDPAPSAYTSAGVRYKSDWWRRSPL